MFEKPGNSNTSGERVSAASMSGFRVDPERIGLGETGIFVRALGVDDRWGSHDIAELTRPSLIAWLRIHGRDDPRMPTNTVLAMLGHAHLSEGE